MKVCFATNNPNKLREVEQMLPSGWKLTGLKEAGIKEEVPETSDTIAGNSLQKTQYVYDRINSPCFGDDTGLVVPALNGEPGVYSAMYAGDHRSAEDNMALLLQKLEGKADRSAYFITVITYIDQSGEIHQFEGKVNGTITPTRSGKDGFGYDPIFLPNGHNETFAEMSMDLKNTISHRAQAIRQLIQFLKSK